MLVAHFLTRSRTNPQGSSMEDLSSDASPEGELYAEEWDSDDDALPRYTGFVFTLQYCIETMPDRAVEALRKVARDMSCARVGIAFFNDAHLDWPTDEQWQILIETGMPEALLDLLLDENLYDFYKPLNSEGEEANVDEDKIVSTSSYPLLQKLICISEALGNAYRVVSRPLFPRTRTPRGPHLRAPRPEVHPAVGDHMAQTCCCSTGRSRTVGPVVA